MDSFAYLQLAVAYETFTDPQFFKGLNWKKLSSQTYIHLMSLLTALLIISIASAANAVLRPGDNGESVRVLQQRLKDLGYFPVGQSTTIYYRQITQNAVQRFQRAYALYGLRPTGIADDWTLYYLGLGPQPQIRPQPFNPSPSRPPGLSTRPTTIRYCQGWRFGERGSHVTQLQEKLKYLGYFYGKVDGKYRERTLSAVTRFQQANNLAATGCVDQTTWNAINYGYQETSGIPLEYIPPTSVSASVPASVPTYTTTLRRGSRGQAVRNLQRKLANLGLYSGAIDGDFGPLTQDALKAFQRSADLRVTGEAALEDQVALSII